MSSLVESDDTAMRTTSDLNFSTRLSIEGNSLMQGSHQEAQKFKITTLSLKSCRRTIRPLRLGAENSGTPFSSNSLNLFADDETWVSRSGSPKINHRAASTTTTIATGSKA